MMGGKWVKWIFLALLGVLVSGCVSRPDLARLYESASAEPGQPPVIVLHGLAGSTLVGRESGKEFWPGSLGTLAFSDYRHLAQMSAEDREGEGLVPGDLFYAVAGVDFYGALLRSLETVGRFQRGVPGQPVDDGERRRYYVMPYDWRKDNIVAVRQLHTLIEQIRADYQDPDLRVDIIAHSNGGLIANYYLRYGATDVLEQPSFTPWKEGDARIRRLVMLGTPALGAVTSLERLIYGTRMAVRTIPVEVMATFATPFHALPHPLVQPIIDPAGQALDIDIFDPAVWRAQRWGVFSAEVIERVRGSMPDSAAGDKALTELQATFANNLHRGKRLQWALTAPFQATTVEIAVFGGDCEPTPGRAVLVQEASGPRLVFRPGQVTPNRIGERRKAGPRLDYERLMLEPGDGLVTRASQVARTPVDREQAAGRFDLIPISQTFFLCESHGRLTHNAYFQNNLLYFLLSR